MLLVYSVCIRGALRCFFNKFALTYQKKKNYMFNLHFITREVKDLSKHVSGVANLHVTVLANLC
jgi:hypothetical protein